MDNEILLLREENTRLKNIIASLAGKIMRIEKALYANDENNIGVINPVYANDENDKLIHTIVSSNENKMYGVNNIKNANAENINGGNSVASPVAEKNIGVNTSADAIAEISKAIKPPDLWKVESGLRKIMVTASGSGVRNTAKILIQLHTQPRNPYKELRKLTGLSEDGLTKRIMAMKKKGLIVRTAFQHYTLTANATEIIHAAMV